MEKHLVRLAVWVALATVLLAAGAPRGFAHTAIVANAGTLVSAGFTDTCSSAPYSGVEPLAQSANPIAFGAANDWNALGLGACGAPGQSSPSFSNLVDNNGNPTPVGLQFTGTVTSWNCGALCTNGIFTDFIYLNGGILDWTLTGLAPDSVAYMYFYGFGADQSYREFNMAVGGSPNGTYTVDYNTGVYVPNIQVSSIGTITGEMQWTGGQSSWSGFQVYGPEQTPEPSTLALFGLGVALVAIRRARRR
jgi:hypothetical protein